jgi:hypothetical protein
MPHGIAVCLVTARVEIRCGRSAGSGAIVGGNHLSTDPAERRSSQSLPRSRLVAHHDPRVAEHRDEGALLSFDHLQIRPARLLYIIIQVVTQAVDRSELPRA